MTTLRDNTARANAATPARSVDDLLSRSRDTVDPVLRSEVDALPTPMRRIAGYHLGWWDEHGNATDTGSGKAFRPALTLLCADAVGAKRSAPMRSSPPRRRRRGRPPPSSSSTTSRCCTTT